MSLAQSLLPEFDHEMAGLRRSLARVPAEHYEFRPHPKSFTLGQLANHLATVPAWAASTMATTELDFALPETQARMPKPERPKRSWPSSIKASPPPAKPLRRPRMPTSP